MRLVFLTKLRKLLPVINQDKIGHFWKIIPLFMIGGVLIVFYARSYLNSPYLIPENPGDLRCQYTNITFAQDNGTMYAQIFGRTLNSSEDIVCANQILPYSLDYYDIYGDKNISQFEEKVRKKFPIGSQINCSVISTYEYFLPFEYDAYGDTRAMRAFITIILVLAISSMLIAIAFSVILIFRTYKLYQLSELESLRRQSLRRQSL